MKRWEISSADVDGEGCAVVAQALKDGQLVAFPTETVYGLGANALDETAVRRIFAAKRRPVDNPLIVHVASKAQLVQITPADFRLSPTQEKLIDAFWPGPFTLILPAGQNVATSVLAGLHTVAVRMPNHPVALALIEQAGVPIAAPSANLSGRPSPTTASAVVDDLGDRVDHVVDNGSTQIGVESTVLLVEAERAVILRPGGVTQEMISKVIDIPVVFDVHVADIDRTPLAPGMKYRHYAPDASVHVWWGDDADVYAAMRERLASDDGEPLSKDMKAAIIAPRDFLHRFDFGLPSSALAPLDSADYPMALANSLYALLRQFDFADVTDILIYGVNPAHGLGTAVMNRLQKASEGRVYRA